MLKRLLIFTLLLLFSGCISSQNFKEESGIWINPKFCPFDNFEKLDLDRKTLYNSKGANKFDLKNNVLSFPENFQMNIVGVSDEVMLVKLEGEHHIYVRPTSVEFHGDQNESLEGFLSGKLWKQEWGSHTYYFEFLPQKQMVFIDVAKDTSAFVVPWSYSWFDKSLVLSFQNLVCNNLFISELHDDKIIFRHALDTTFLTSELVLAENLNRDTRNNEIIGEWNLLTTDNYLVSDMLKKITIKRDGTILIDDEVGNWHLDLMGLLVITDITSNGLPMTLRVKSVGNGRLTLNYWAHDYKLEKIR